MIVARRLVISGRVQGVGFRFFVRDAASVENVGGWVRNLQDGRVEVFAEGDLASVDRLERRIRRGPPAARVDAVEVFDDEAPSPSRPPFTIKPST